MLSDQRVGRRGAAFCVHAGAVVCILFCNPSWVAAADADEIEELKRAIKALREENRELSRRVRALEEEKAQREPSPKSGVAQEPGQAPPPPTAETKKQEQLEQRVEQLEKSKTAQEDAVRNIVRDSLAKTGSMINEFVTLGGNIEVSAGRASDFYGAKESGVQLTAAQLEFDVRATPWASGKLVVEYDPGTNVVFPSTTGFTPTNVERINVDRAYILIGDTQRFPPFLKAGRMVLPFGISTGSTWADVLSVENPLTVEVFETRKTAVGFGLAFPTPALQPLAPPVAAPPVKPQVISPLVQAISKGLGYEPPPTRPQPLPLVSPTPAPPLFNAGIYFYSGNADTTNDMQPSIWRHVDATVGFHTRGHCGRRYDQLSSGGLCPWTLDVDLSWNSSVYDSQFLENGYVSFLNEIGLVPGATASLKSSLGPVAIVAEWNGALQRAMFVDDANRRISLKPSAWQVSLGYQFDWNPWVETIGDQGTYVSIGYSRSVDLAGVTDNSSGVATRVGYVPEKRLILTAGEWVLEGTRVVFEYSYNWDYPKTQGGTGNIAHGFFASLLYVW